MGRVEPLEPRHATFGHIVEPSSPGRPVDQVVGTYFQAPRSYTLEDVVELSAHGSPPLLDRTVALAVAAGARLAEPGEFTFRAYLNGRLDLVQAEAVADLVDAVTPLQARTAMDQLEGTLTTAIGAIESRLFDLIARLEASLDFPDEGFHFITRSGTRDAIEALADAIDDLVRDGRAGRVIREGSLIVIIGAPNAGKSSLFNALLGSARAIVTDVPGTTRDVLSEKVDINGVAVTLIDTAGLRQAGDAIEAEGVRRAEQARDIAALTLVVIDGSEPLDARSVERLLGGAVGPHLVIASKADRPRAWADAARLLPESGAIAVSVVTGEGLEVLRRRIVHELTSRDHWRDPPAVSNMRHLDLLTRTKAAIDRATAALEAGSTEEVLLVELTQARQLLEAITGRTTADDLLHHIFGRFCIGK
jgi:tRNA modification GTPase